MKFKKIKILGFKSFVDQTDIDIEEGLTGIVGPNGCGKSNVVESLRWCMGETSPKSMRSSGMEDVIFSGTTDRPARNNAEVTIFLDNKDRNAPAEFNNDEEMYQHLWKLMYDIDIPKNDKDFLESIVDYVNGEKILV